MARRARYRLEYSRDGRTVILASDRLEYAARREYDVLVRQLMQARRAGSFAILRCGGRIVGEWREEQLALEMIPAETLARVTESIQRHVDREREAA